MTTSRPIVITPYYKEDRATLMRCMTSVRNQTVPTEHLMIADGHPQDWVDAEPVRHLKLDRAHGDYGNTPRGIGATLAAADGYAPIMMLDADNWLEPDHVDVCLRAAASAAGTDYVIAGCQLRRPDGTIMPVPASPPTEHVDTSRFVFFPGSYQTLPLWALMPQQMSPIGDRVFWSALQARGLAGVIVSDRITVNYLCLWESYYRALGEVPPAGAKPNIDPRPMYEWWAGLSAREQLIVTRLTGISLTAS